MATAIVYHLGFAGSLSNEPVGIKRFKIAGEHADEKVLSGLFEYDNMPSEMRAGFFDDENPDPVTLVKQSGCCYSLSVGDVVRVGRNYYICLPCGWKHIMRGIFKLKVRAWFRRSRPRLFFQDWAGFLYKNEIGREPASFELEAGKA